MEKCITVIGVTADCDSELNSAKHTFSHPLFILYALNPVHPLLPLIIIDIRNPVNTAYMGPHPLMVPYSLDHALNLWTKVTIDALYLPLCLHQLLTPFAIEIILLGLILKIAAITCLMDIVITGFTDD